MVPWALVRYRLFACLAEFRLRRSYWETGRPHRPCLQVDLVFIFPLLGRGLHFAHHLRTDSDLTCSVLWRDLVKASTCCCRCLFKNLAWWRDILGLVLLMTDSEFSHLVFWLFWRSWLVFGDGFPTLCLILFNLRALQLFLIDGNRLFFFFLNYGDFS